MRKIAAVLSLMILVAVGAVRAEAGDADTIAAINASSNALDKAFGERDIETIRALMTPDHVTVTPYYDGPQSVDDQIASLPELDYGQTIVGEPSVALLGPDVAASLLAFSAAWRSMSSRPSGFQSPDRRSGGCQSWRGKCYSKKGASRSRRHFALHSNHLDSRNDCAGIAEGTFGSRNPREATMGSFNRPRAFDSLDLEIIDRVYEVAWAQLEASEPFRDRAKDGERGEALRKLLFAFVGSGQVDFDALCDKVLANMPGHSMPIVPPTKRGRKVEGGTPGA